MRALSVFVAIVCAGCSSPGFKTPEDVPFDLTLPPDFATPPDLVTPPDLTPPDLAGADFSMPDLKPPPDLTPPPDLLPPLDLLPPPDLFACSGGAMLCSGTCVDLQSDVGHCGNCNVICTASSHATAACTSGGCCSVCNPGSYQTAACSPTIDTKCALCAIGTFAKSNATSCTTCSTCTGTQFTTACTSSTDTLCTTCPAGMSGDGTTSSPCLVTTCTQLQAVSQATSFSYRLASNIDCSATSSANGGAGFTPIATFAGDFDGASHTIDKLYMHSAQTTIAFIGTLTGSMHDLDLTNVDIASSAPVTGSMPLVAAVVATTSTGTFQNVTSTGNVTSTFGHVGGLVADMSGGSMANSGSSVAVSTTATSGTQLVGGVVASLSGTSTLSSGHGTGRVNVANGIGGGVVGQQSEGTMISNCDALATVTVSGLYGGGLVGYAMGSISSSHTTGPVAVTGDAAGGLVGEAVGATVTASYATGNVTGSGVAPESFYAGGLIGFAEDSPVTACHATGTVTSAAIDPTPCVFGGLVGAFYNSTLGTSYATGYVTAGTQGSYGGGLVGVTSSALVTDSYSVGDVAAGNGVTGSAEAGGLVGQAGGDVTNCYSTGNVNASGDSVVAGGLVGVQYSNVVTNSFSAGTTSVTGGSSELFLEGLVGEQANGASITGSDWFASATSTAMHCWKGTDNVQGDTGCAGIGSAAGVSYFYDISATPMSTWSYGSSNPWSAICNMESFPQLTSQGVTASMQCP